MATHLDSSKINLMVAKDFTVFEPQKLKQVQMDEASLKYEMSLSSFQQRI